MANTKIIVLDDDPTGSQTVHSCLLLTQWDVETLKIGLTHEAPLFFILTNTRGKDAATAEAITRTVCIHLKQALSELEGNHQINPVVVSRSDSTLRGHYPIETDVISEELGPFDAHFMVPAFFEGGRITRDSIHYLISNGETIPVHQTEFAKDSVFGFHHSYLPDYVEEKTQGRIKADAVERFLLDAVRSGDCQARLMALENNVCCAVDSETQADLNHFCSQLMSAAEQGKRFLFRSAASLLTAMAQLPPQPIRAEEMQAYVREGKPGAVIVGSHVKKTTQQLEALLKMPSIEGVEIDVKRIAAEKQTLLDEISKTMQSLHDQGKSIAIYTSRKEETFADQATRLAFGETVSAFLMEIVRHLPKHLGFLISKGGITSNDVLSTGLALRTSNVLGQILPGCSVVRCPADHPQFANLPVVIFPGNVGDETALATAYQRLSNH